MNPLVKRLLGNTSTSAKYLAVAHATSPYITIYKQKGDVFTKLANPATLPGGDCYGCEFSRDGVYLAVASTASPYVIIYKRTGDTFTKLSNPATLPTGAAQGVSFSPLGDYLAVAHATSPYVTIYSRSGDTFTKIANPSILPTGQGNRVTWMADQAIPPTIGATRILAVAHATSPYITYYTISGSTFTKHANPTTLPTGSGVGINWVSQNLFVAVAHVNTPYLTIYQLAATDLNKLTNPTNLPSSFATGVDFNFSPFGDDGGIRLDNIYLAVAFTSSPYIILYKYNSSSGIFTKLTDPVSLPVDAYNVAFSKKDQGLYLAVARASSPYLTIYKRNGDVLSALVAPSTLPAGNAGGVSFYTP